MTSIIKFGAVAAFIAVAFLAITAFDGGSASAADITENNSITFEGTSPDQTIGGSFIYCDTCTPDFLFDCGGCTVVGGFSYQVKTSVQWEAPVDVNTTFDPDQLSQGNDVDVTDALIPGVGTIKLKYEIPYKAGLFAKDGNFGPTYEPAMPYNASDTIVLGATAACTMPLEGAPDKVCSVTKELPIAAVSFLGIGVSANLAISHEFTIGPAGIESHRIVSVGAADDSADLTFNNPLPSTVNDSFALPCDASVGDDVLYSLTQNTYQPDRVRVEGSIGIHLVVDAIFTDLDHTFNLVSGEVFDTDDAGALVMTAEDIEIVMGDVAADNQAPNIAGVIQGGTYVEGSNVSFAAVAGDNCPNGLSYEWQFSDGGQAFGQGAGHIFADNGGYTAMVKVTDDADNFTLHNFNVNPIANANPNATGPAAASSDWGVPVQFYASAVDPGAADQATLQFNWAFGDGTFANGQSVSHAFVAPGVFNGTVTVTDKDGGVGQAPVQTTVGKRDTNLTYTGPVQGLPNKYTTLSATLSDEHGQPVVGRTVTFTLGTQSINAVTNAAGVASIQLKVTQKPATVNVSADFAGDALYHADNSGNTSFKIGK